MIVALTTAIALIATAALLGLLLQKRRFAAMLADRVDHAERLAEGRAATEPSDSITSRLPRPPSLEDELVRLSRALDGMTVRATRDVAAVERERRQLEEILAGVPEGLLLTTSDRVPRYANRGFRELFDVDPAASTAELLALVRRPQVFDTLSRATTGDAGPPVEFAIGARELSVATRQLEGQTGILLMARDVTEANRVARMRRDFVANLSHEIKTPLAVIRGAAETLVETGAEDPEATDRFVHRIIEQIYRLEDLLKDLLTLSRLESPEAGQHRQPVDLASIARRAVELLGPLAVRAEVSLRSEIEAVPALWGDAKALERLVLNLIVNGIQYNHPGGHVTVRLRGHRDTLELEVADNGVGIPSADLPRIFERFYRVDKGRGRAEGGSGLGLAIVKHVVQSHGGSVDVKSEPDRGSIFRVLLPAAEPSSGREGEGDETASTGGQTDRAERALASRAPAP